MRFDQTEGKTAADLLNTLGEARLADIFFHFGEIHASRKLAHAILQTRKINPFQTTTQFAQFVRETLGKSILPQAFQALRIAVNRELDSLEQVLADGALLLAPGARFCVISFHSLEDRLVKQAFRENHLLEVVTPKPLTPGRAECLRNPRARSAKLRVAARGIN